MLPDLSACTNSRLFGSANTAGSCDASAMPARTFLFLNALPMVSPRLLNRIEMKIATPMVPPICLKKVADEVAEDKDAIAKAKLRIDTMLRTAARWDRERYGERDTAGVTVTVNLGDQAKEILALEERLGLGVKSSPALPAPEIVVAEPI